MTYPQDTIHVPGEYATIQLGINAASNGDIVLVEDGTYIENINYRGKAITVASRFLVDGDTNHINNTIIDGSQPSHPDTGSVVLFISGEDTTSILYGFTITGGTGTYITGSPAVRVGGGINCIMSGAKIVYCQISYNTAEYLSGTASGGGIAVGPPGNTHWLILENNTIRNNSVLGATCGGGGITVAGNLRCKSNVIEYNVGESTGGIIFGGGLYTIGDVNNPPLRLILNNTIKYNKAISPLGSGNDGGVGGGLSITGISNETIIKNNIVSHNYVQSNAPTNNCYGGGVFFRDAKETTIFSENYVTFNSALDNSICQGAGICIWSLAGDTSRPQLFNNIIANNTNANYGGGIYISGQSGSGNKPLFINNTIVNNSGSFGGSVYSKNSQPIFINSILWNNGNEIYLVGGDVLVYYSDIEGDWPGEGNIDTDPLFSDPINGDFRLLNNVSPCLESGIDSIDISGTMYYCPPFCINGVPRPSPTGTRPDMGACENPILVSLENDLLMIPDYFSLLQNYPNPFNPRTSIIFDLPEASEVKLTLFNSLGEEVANLFEGYNNAGYHRVEFDAVELPSGVYFYQLKAGRYVETKKMVLMK